MASEVLDEAYVRLHHWGPEFGGGNGLSNHGPMAVEVLSRRGFDDQLAAIKDLQHQVGLPQTGTMNPATQAALASYLAHGNNQMAG